MPIDAIEQSRLSAFIFLLSASISNARHSAFLRARLLAYASIFLLRNNCVIISTNNFLSLSTFT